MKKILLLTFVCFFTIQSNAQNAPLKGEALIASNKTMETIKKYSTLEPIVLKRAEFVLDEMANRKKQIEKDYKENPAKMTELLLALQEQKLNLVKGYIGTENFAKLTPKELELITNN